jgi:hypothetical protein
MKELIEKIEKQLIKEYEQWDGNDPKLMGRLDVLDRFLEIAYRLELAKHPETWRGAIFMKETEGEK